MYEPCWPPPPPSRRRRTRRGVQHPDHPRRRGLVRHLRAALAEPCPGQILARIDRVAAVTVSTWIHTPASRQAPLQAGARGLIVKAIPAESAVGPVGHHNTFACGPLSEIASHRPLCFDLPGAAEGPTKRDQCSSCDDADLKKQGAGLSRGHRRGLRTRHEPPSTPRPLRTLSMRTLTRQVVAGRAVVHKWIRRLRESHPRRVAPPKTSSACPRLSVESPKTTDPSLVHPQVGQNCCDQRTEARCMTMAGRAVSNKR